MTESVENYLKTILIIHKRKGEVLCADVAAELDFSRASVTVATRKLRQEGLLEKERRDLVLTEKGRKLAERTCERHDVFARMLCEAGVDSRKADADACRLEHAISDESFAAVKDLLTKMLVVKQNDKEAVPEGMREF